jgi:hypothetical protein
MLAERSWLALRVCVRFPIPKPRRERSIHRGYFAAPPRFFISISLGHSFNEFQYSCQPSPCLKTFVSPSLITSTVPSNHSAITLSAPVYTENTIRRLLAIAVSLI